MAARALRVVEIGFQVSWLVCLKAIVTNRDLFILNRINNRPAPFAMVKLGPDVQSGNTDAYSGYLPNGNIWGFSMTHESGTGGAPK